MFIHASDQANRSIHDAPAAVGTLRELFGGTRLSPAQRRIARYILENLDEAVFLSSSELGERAGVSQPSVTRFATALGMSGYPELRARVRELVAARPPVATRPTDRLTRTVAAEARNLERLLESVVDPGALMELGRALAGSTPLVVAGSRVAAHLAVQFDYLGRKVHPDIRLVTDTGTRAADVVEQARASGAEWILAFSLPRHARSFAELLEWARGLGYRIALVAEDPFSPLEADVTLSAPVGEELVFDSHAAPHLLTMMLLQAMFDALPRGRQSRLDDFERLAADRRLFLER